MNSGNDKKYISIKKAPLIIGLLVLGAGLLGWWLGYFNAEPSSQSTSTSQTPTPGNNTDDSEVKSLVTYTLPDGWKEASCPAAADSIYILPDSDVTLNCDANPSAPIKISIDPANNTDCNQLQNVQNVSKHICISEFINGKKSLKAETIYNSSSSYKTDTTINAYYINTGDGVIKVEYIHPAANNEYQVGFEQLAKSIQVK